MISTGIPCALRDALDTRRRQRAGDAIVARYWRKRRSEQKTPRAMRRSYRSHVHGAAMLLGLPVLAPLFTYLAERLATTEATTSGAAVTWLHVLACLAVITLGGHTTARHLLYFSSTDILRLPSKAGIFLLRMWQQLPLMLWVGGCWSVAWAIKLPGPLRAEPIAGSALLAAVALVPVLWTIGRARAQLTVVRESFIGPLLPFGLAGVVLFATLHRPALDVADVLLSIAMGLLAALSLVGIDVSWRRARPAAIWVDLMTAQRWIVAAGVLLPAEAWAAVPIGICGYGALAVVVLGIAVAIWRLVPLLQYAEERPPSVGPVRRADELEPQIISPPPMPARHRGRRSLMRALVFEYRCRSFHRRGEIRRPLAAVRALPGMLIVLVYHAWGILLATLAVALTTSSNVQLLLPVLAALTAPTFVTHALDHRHWLLGVSYRRQALHNLVCIVLLAAVPVLAAGTATGFLMGWNVERAAVLALMAGLLAVRAGLPGLLRDSEFDALQRRMPYRMPVVAAVLLALLLLPHLVPPVPATWVLLTGTLLLAVGALGVRLRLGRLDEQRLVREQCDIDEHSYSDEALGA